MSGRTGRKFQTARTQVERGRLYEPVDALELVRKVAYARFDESVEVAVNLGVDPRHADQIVRGTVALPHGTGKTVKVLVIADGDKAKEAQDAGAEFVGVEYVDKIKQGWLECDVVVATPDQMSQVGQLGRILGPRGMMPNPKSGTVTPNVQQAINDIKAGKIEFRVDKTGNLHAPIGRVSFDTEKLKDNLSSFMDVVVRAKPAAAKGTYIKSITVSSSMGPGVKINAAVFR